MKYPAIFVLFPFFIVLFSCDSDDEPPHPMVGVWQILQVFQQGEALLLDNCAMLTTSEFRAEGIFFEKRFSKRILGCSLNNESGTWVETGENIVRITYDNGTSDFQNIKFTISDSKMTLTDGDGSKNFVIVLRKVE